MTKIRRLRFDNSIFFYRKPEITPHNIFFIFALKWITNTQSVTRMCELMNTWKWYVSNLFWIRLERSQRQKWINDGTVGCMLNIVKITSICSGKTLGYFVCVCVYFILSTFKIFEVPRLQRMNISETYPRVVLHSSRGSNAVPPRFRIIYGPLKKKGGARDRPPSVLRSLFWYPRELDGPLNTVWDPLKIHGGSGPIAPRPTVRSIQYFPLFFILDSWNWSLNFGHSVCFMCW